MTLTEHFAQTQDVLQLSTIFFKGHFLFCRSQWNIVLFLVLLLKQNTKCLALVLVSYNGSVTTLIPNALYFDNQSTCHIAHNLNFHERMKHIDIDYYMVRGKIQDNLFHLLPIRSSDQLADMFTKILNRVAFSNISYQIGYDEYTSSNSRDTTRKNIFIYGKSS